MATMPIPPMTMPMGAGGAQGPTIGTQGQPAPQQGSSMMPAGGAPSPQKLVEDFLFQVHSITLDIQALAGQYGDPFAPAARQAIDALEAGTTPVVNSIQGAETPPSPAVAR